jgi:hypothetical protein
MKASEFEQKFDADEDLTACLDLAQARRPGLEKTQVSMDFPAWMVQSIDREAHRLGVSRQDLIKFWLADRLRRDHA